MVTFGVDEAGKGPVFGSMFAAAVHAEAPAHLPDGIADSKRLSPARREDFDRALRADDRIRIGVAEVPVDRIDDPETDMNGLAVGAHARAIDAVFEGALDETGLADATGVESDDDRNVRATGLCDACDTDADRFAERVADACEADVAVDARHGADDDSPIVGAASVVAKVERDAHVAAIAEEYGDVGSGYPSDPATRAFLEEYVESHAELPPFARRSWSTCEDALAAAEQAVLDRF